MDPVVEQILNDQAAAEQQQRLETLAAKIEKMPSAKNLISLTNRVKELIVQVETLTKSMQQEED